MTETVTADGEVIRTESIARRLDLNDELANMPEAEFEARLKSLRLAHDRMRKIIQTVLIGPSKGDPEGEDYGVMPGTTKVGLKQPGAEKLLKFFRLVPTFDQTITYGDGIDAPQIMIVIKCAIHQEDERGPIIGEGFGAANSWEKKYRYRGGDRACPKCSKVGTVIKGKAEYGGGWLCWDRKGGCGEKWPDGAPEIEQQQLGQIENPNPFDLLDTMLKMAKKRSLTDGCKTSTATSGLLGQDFDEVKDRGDAPAKEVKLASEQLVFEVDWMLTQVSPPGNWSKLLTIAKVKPPRGFTNPADPEAVQFITSWLSDDDVRKLWMLAPADLRQKALDRRKKMTAEETASAPADAPTATDGAPAPGTIPADAAAPGGEAIPFGG